MAQIYFSDFSVLVAVQSRPWKIPLKIFSQIRNFFSNSDSDKQQKIFSNKNRDDGEFDLGRKVREDPLAMVKEKENERFKKLQANPQKMARMKKLMMAYMGGQESSDSSSASEDDEPKRFEIIFSW